MKARREDKTDEAAKAASSRLMALESLYAQERQEREELSRQLEDRNRQLEDRSQQLGEQTRELDRQRQENDILRAKLRILEARMFGRKTEVIDPSQRGLFEEMLLADGGSVDEPVEGDSGEELAPAPRQTHGRRKGLPKGLVRREIVVDVPEVDKTCSTCGTEKVVIGEDRTERLEPPAPPTVLVEVRPKYACPSCHDGVAQAAAPFHIVEKGLATEALLAHLVSQKYAFHQPLHRLEKLFARFEIEISRSTLCEWMQKVAFSLEPIYEHEKKRIFKSGYINTDDTSIVVMKGREPPLHKGRLWVYHAPELGAVVYEATLTHEARWPLEHLSGFRGYLQADAYTGYDAVYRSLPVVEVGCWAHARRRVHDAVTAGDQRGARLLALIGRLFAFEKRAKDDGLDSAAVREVRQRDAVPVLDKVFVEVKRLVPIVIPKAPLGQALTYLTNQEAALRRYADDGRLSISNNAAERLLRGVAVGRKNWLFCGSLEGAKTAAILYSLVEGCRLVGIDPERYLTDVMQRVATHPAKRVDELTPTGWAKNTFAPATTA